MFTRAFSSILTIGCLAATLVGTSARAGTDATYFHSFEYRGQDTAFETPLPAGTYRNPILAGFYPDPSICRVGEDYYLINSTFAYFPGIPVFHSRDLVNWRQIGNVIHRPSQMKFDGLGVSRGIFAPAIEHHEGVFYVVCTMVDGGGNFLVTATNPAGPWSDPIWYDFEGIDPSLFFDEDGRAWLVNNGAPEGEPLYQGHRAIWLQQFDPKTKGLIGPRQVIVNGGVDLAKKPIWVEGPHIYRRGEWYYLSCAEGGTGDHHSQVIFRSKAVTGPWEPWQGNPILTQRDLSGNAPGAVTCTGHADMVVGPDGQWWTVFLGCRPYANGHYNTGRETFLLPVAWTEDGWPRILPAGQRVPLVVRAPQLPAGVAPSEAPLPLTGNHVWRETFRGDALPLHWMTLRAWDMPRWGTRADRDGIAVAPGEPLSGKSGVVFIGRRVQHARFEATTHMNLPRMPTTSAGVAVFQNETHHFYFGLRLTPAGPAAFVERLNGGAPEALAEIPAKGSAPFELKVTAVDAKVSFALRSDGGEWVPVLEGTDAKLLSTKAAGGFVGAMIGLHARREK